MKCLLFVVSRFDICGAALSSDQEGDIYPSSMISVSCLRYRLMHTYFHFQEVNLVISNTL